MAKKLTKKTEIVPKFRAKQISAVYEQIAVIIRDARAKVVRAIDTTMVHTYWHIGKYIVEEEQTGKTRADYGKHLLLELSNKLTEEFGKGFSATTLEYARKFYKIYGVENPHAVRERSKKLPFHPNLAWIHYRALMREGRKIVRDFYEVEAIKNCWSGRELERQMDSLLFERLSKSKDKKGLMKLANKGNEIIKPEDAIKDPIILEFLNLPESHKLIESKLEEALINNMQKFLLEFGKGFAFVARQKRLTLDGQHFYADLVMYNTVLHAYTIIDLKTKPLTHADLGQMQLYVNYFDMEITTLGDNPTIGLILCTRKSDKMVKYFFKEKDRKIFASKYQFHLPTEQELEIELKKEIDEFRYKLKS